MCGFFTTELVTYRLMKFIYIFFLFVINVRKSKIVVHNLSETDKQKKSHGNAAIRHEPAAEQTPAKAACISHRIR